MSHRLRTPAVGAALSALALAACGLWDAAESASNALPGTGAAK